MDGLDDSEAMVKKRGHEVLEATLVAYCAGRLTVRTSDDQVDSRKLDDVGGVNLCDILRDQIKQVA